MKSLVLLAVLASSMAIAQPAKRDTGVPCSALTKDATTQERKFCSKQTIEDYCKNITSDTTRQSRKLCEKKAAAAASAASK